MASSPLYAFVTLLTSDSYLPGALALVAALHEVHHGAPSPPELPFATVCLVTPETVDVSTLKALRQVFDLVVGVEVITESLGNGLQLLGRPDLHQVLTKLHVFRLSQFQKLIFLDSDVLPIRPISHLFALEHEFSAAPDVGWPDIFNSGVMVLTPGEEKFNEIMKMIKSKGSWDGGDQGILNEWRGGNWGRLSFTYNTTPTAAYTYAPAYERFGSQINAIHFIGANKPWNDLPWRAPGSASKVQREGAEDTGPLVPSQPLPSYGYPTLVDKWFEVYDRNYRPIPPEDAQAPPLPPKLIPSIPGVFQFPKYSNAWDHPVIRQSRGGGQGGATMDLERLKQLALGGVNSAFNLEALSKPKSDTLTLGFVDPGSSNNDGAPYITMPLDGRAHLMTISELAAQRQAEAKDTTQPQPLPSQTLPVAEAEGAPSSEPPSYLFRPVPERPPSPQGLHPFHAYHQQRLQQDGKLQADTSQAFRDSEPPGNEHSGQGSQSFRSGHLEHKTFLDGASFQGNEPSSSWQSFPRDQRSHSEQRVASLPWLAPPISQPSQQAHTSPQPVSHKADTPQGLIQQRSSPQVSGRFEGHHTTGQSPPAIRPSQSIHAHADWNPNIYPPVQHHQNQHAFTSEYHDQTPGVAGPRPSPPRPPSPPLVTWNPAIEPPPTSVPFSLAPLALAERHYRNVWDFPSRDHRHRTHHLTNPTNLDEPHVQSLRLPQHHALKSPQHSQHHPLYHPQDHSQDHPHPHPHPHHHHHQRVHSEPKPHQQHGALDATTHGAQSPHHHHQWDGHAQHEQHVAPHRRHGSHSPVHHTHHHHHPHYGHEHRHIPYPPPSDSSWNDPYSSHGDHKPPSPAPEAFFEPPVHQWASIPQQLIKEGHYAAVTSRDLAPQPDRRKVTVVFPWEERPRRAPGRVFPKSSSPPPMFIELQPEPKTKPVSPEPEPTKEAEPDPPPVVIPKTARVWRDYSVITTPTAAAFGSAAYSNAWDNVPSIKKYASRLVKPSSISSLFNPIPESEKAQAKLMPSEKMPWEDRADIQSDANSHDGDDEDEESEDDGPPGKGEHRSPSYSKGGSRRSSTATNRSASSSGPQSGKTYSTKGVSTYGTEKSYRSQGVQTVSKTTQSRGVQVNRPPYSKRSKGASVSTSPVVETSSLPRVPSGTVGDAAGFGRRIRDSGGRATPPTFAGTSQVTFGPSTLLFHESPTQSQPDIPTGVISPRLNEPIGDHSPTTLTPIVGPNAFGGSSSSLRTIGPRSTGQRDSTYSTSNRDSMFTATSANRDSMYSVTSVDPTPTTPKARYETDPIAGGNLPTPLLPHIRTSSNETGLTGPTGTSPPSSQGPGSPNDDEPLTLHTADPPTSSAIPRKVPVGRKWDPDRGVEIFKRDSQEVLAKFLKMGSWGESPKEGPSTGIISSPTTTSPAIQNQGGLVDRIPE